MSPGKRLGALPGGIELEPICGTVAEAHNSAIRKNGDSGIIEPYVAVEAWNTEVFSGRGQVVRVPVIQGIGNQVLAANAKIVHQVGCYRLRVADDPVPGLDRN